MEIKRSIGISIIMVFFAACLTSAFGQESNLKKVDFKDLPLDSKCFYYIDHLRHTDERGASIPPDPIIINSEDEYKILLKLKPDDSNIVCTHKYDSSDGGQWFKQCEGPKEYVAQLEKKCLNVDLPKIDFSQVTVLAQYAVTYDFPANFDKQVLRDDINKQIVYSISVSHRSDPQGLCTECPYTESLNLIVIPKVPSGYKVIFHNK